MPGTNRTRRRALLGSHVLAGVLAGHGGISVAAAGQTVPPILQVRSRVVTILLVDAYSTRPIADTLVQMSSDDKVRCVTGPCYAQVETWQGRTDRRGAVTVPTKRLREQTDVTAGKFFGSLADTASRADRAGYWVTAMFPSDDQWPCPPCAPRPIELVDRIDGMPIVDAPVQVKFRPGSADERILNLKTNSLGWLFVPFEAVGDDTSVNVAGYRPIRPTFQWTKHLNRLEPD